jgi:hypothetical protein
MQWRACDLDVLGGLASQTLKQHADEPPGPHVEEGKGYWRIILSSQSSLLNARGRVSEPYEPCERCAARSSEHRPLSAVPQQPDRLCVAVIVDDPDLAPTEE